MELTKDQIYDQLYDHYLLLVSRELNVKSLGRSRVVVRQALYDLQHNAEIKLVDLDYELRLLISVGKHFHKIKEFQLASDCFEYVIGKSGNHSDETSGTVIFAQATYSKVYTKYAELNALSTNTRSAPIMVTKLIGGLHELHNAILKLCELPTTTQESISWLILNGCKLILKMGEPLVWLNSGRYIADLILFAAMTMESIVNLCTTRHLKFRMKLYLTALYTVLVYGADGDSDRYLEHIIGQIKALRAQEELDLPMPKSTETALLAADADLALMRAIVIYWKSPDALAEDMATDEDALQGKFEHPCKVAGDGGNAVIPTFSDSFASRILCEYSRIQQVTSGNRNEVWKRRAVGLLKGFKTFYRLLSEATPQAEAEGGGEAATETSTKDLLLDESILEIMSINLFAKQNEDEDFKLDTEMQLDVLNRLASSKSDFLTNDVAVANESLTTLLEAFVRLSAINAVEDRIAFLKASITFSRALEVCLSNDSLHLKRSLLVQTAMNLWKECIYPSIQKILSSQEKHDMVFLNSLLPSLLNIYSVLNMSYLDDAVMMGSSALLLAKLYNQFNDYRSAISVLTRALDLMDNHRADRVHAALHMPMEACDTHAIQHASFTSVSDAQDWYNSIKRLGAHAFAGFGIFGSASIAERQDQALSELHTDLTTLYIRCELEYGLMRKRHRKATKYYKYDRAYYDKHTTNRIKIRKNDFTPTELNNGGAPFTGEGEAADELKDNDDEGEGESPSSKEIEASATGEGDEEKKAEEEQKDAALLSTEEQKGLTINDQDLDELAPEAEYKANTDMLRIVGYLRKWCVDNTQASALLCVELANLDGRTDAQVKFLDKATKLLFQSEERERELKETNKDLTLMTIRDLRSPLIVARTHKFIHVIPVACRKFEQKMRYTRVYAKEEKGGTDVTSSNNELRGCETRIFSENYRHQDSLSRCVVQFDALKWGKQYKFATVNFDDKDNTVGKLSPSTAPIEAKNPLSNSMIWFAIHRIATKFAADDKEIRACARNAAVQISNAFIHPQRPLNISPFTVGHGKTVFIGKDIAISLLKVQQSSKVQLMGFVEAFLFFVEDDMLSIPEKYRRAHQSKIVSHLRSIGYVGLIAYYSGSEDLVIRCMLRGYELASALLFSDDSNLAKEIQNPLVMMVVVMQSISKQNWNDTEHEIYAKMVSALIKVSKANGEVKSILPIIETLFEQDVDPSSEWYKINKTAKSNYYALEFLLWRQKAQLKMEDSQAVLKHFENVYVNEPAAEDDDEKAQFWKASTPQQQHMILVNGADSLADGSSVIMGYLDTADVEVSKYLRTVKEMLKIGLHTAESPSSAFEIITAVAKIERKKVDPTIVDLMSQFRVQVVGISEADEVEADADAEAEQDGEEKRAEPVLEEGIPDLEKRKQAVQLAEIIFMKAKYVYYPQLKNLRALEADKGNGVDENIDLNAGEMVDTMKITSSDDVAGGEEGEAADEEAIPDVRLQYIQHLCVAILLYTQGGFHSSAVHSNVTLWSYLVESWTSPTTFIAQFGQLKQHFTKLVASLVTCLQEVVSEGKAEDALDDSEKDLFSTYSPREEDMPVARIDIPSNAHLITSKQYLLCCSDMFLYILKLLWLTGQYEDLVVYGMQCLEVYMYPNDIDCVQEVGKVANPVLTEAQQRIVDSCNDKFNATTMKLTSCIDSFKEKMKSKRRKKTRLAATVKDDDEIAHDVEVEGINGEIEGAKSELEFHRDRFSSLTLLTKRYDSMLSTSVQLFYKVQSSAQEFISEFYKTDMAADPAVTLTTELPTKLMDSYEDLMDEYNQLSDFLREKQDRNVLIEALNEQGDVMMLCGYTSQARKVFHDALDGFFNAMDAYKNWKSVAATALATFQSDGVAPAIKGLMNSLLVLGKLSKYCSDNEWDMKLLYCRFAADLCRIPFFESYGHPVCAIGFAGYVCEDLGAAASYILNTDRRFMHSLGVSLEEIVNNLDYFEFRIEALPAVTLLEYIHLKYTKRADRWLKSRMTRIRLLTGIHMFAEAASMIASIQYTLSTFSHYEYVLEEGQTIDAVLASSRNGMKYYGKAPFFNHLLPTSDDNKAACEWIGQYPGQFKAFAEEVEATIPERPTLDVDPASEEEGTETPMLPPKPSFLGTSAVSEMTLLCAAFLVELSLLESRVETDQMEFLKGIGTTGLDLLEALAKEEEEANNTAITDNGWMSRRCRHILLKTDVLIRDRKYMVARNVLVNVVQLLKTATSDNSAASKELRTHMWYRIRDRLAQIAYLQARWTDVVTLSIQGISEMNLSHSSHWIRKASLWKALAWYQLGDIQSCLEDCDFLYNSYKDNACSDEGFLRCITLKASMVLDLITSGLKQDVDFSNNANMKDLQTCIDLLKEAFAVAQELSAFAGFLGGDVNVTYTGTENNVSKKQFLSPVLLGLTNIPYNEQNLFIANGMKLNGYEDTVAKVDESLLEPRLGPTDADENTMASSEYINIYLPQVRNLATCCSALTIIRENFDMLSKSETDSYQEFMCDETGLKVLRHISFANPQVRASLLHSVGRRRLHKAVGVVSQDFVQPRAKRLNEDLVPLLNSMNIALSNFHDWNSMRTSSAHTANIIISATQDSNTSADISNALKFITSAIRIKSMLRTVEKQHLDSLNTQDAFAAMEGPVKEKVKASALASADVAEKSMGSGAAPTDPKGKGGGTDDASKVTGSDAVFLLSSFLKEQNLLWMDDAVRSDYYDLSRILTKTSALYQGECVLPAVPIYGEEEDSLQLPGGSISSLWLRSKDEVAQNGDSLVMCKVYLLFGANDEQDQPFFKTRMVLRNHISALRQSILDLRKYYKIDQVGHPVKDRCLEWMSEIFSTFMQVFSTCADNASEGLCEVKSGGDAPQDVVISIQGTDINVTDEFLLNLANVLDPDRDVDRLENKDVATFVNAA